jgi:hypothetical protein
VAKIPTKQKKDVLVAVVKNRRDLNLILKEGWYRIPEKYAPKQKFKYLAFYLPASGKLGKKITFYAKIKKIARAARRELLPKEITHPRAGNLYLRFELGKIYKLPRPIKNKSRRRVSFGFTTLSRLKKAKDILGLYDVPPIEEIFEKALKKALKNTGATHIREYTISKNRKRYRLDFAIFFPSSTFPRLSASSPLLRRSASSLRKSAPSPLLRQSASPKRIAIECDGTKSHSLPAQKLKDQAKDKFLRANGWQLLRFTEKEIVADVDNCILKLKTLLLKS